MHSVNIFFRLPNLLPSLKLPYATTRKLPARIRSTIDGVFDQGGQGQRGEGAEGESDTTVVHEAS